MTDTDSFSPFVLPGSVESTVTETTQAKHTPSSACTLCQGSLESGGVPLPCCSKCICASCFEKGDCGSCPVCKQVHTASDIAVQTQKLETNPEVGVDPREVKVELELSQKEKQEECVFCHEHVVVSEKEDHVCSFKEFMCPFSALGCNEKIHPSELEPHFQEKILDHLHLACTKIVELEREAIEREEKELLAVNEKESLKNELADLKAHPRFQLLLSEIRSGAHTENVYASPRFLDRYSSLRDQPSKLIAKLVTNGDGFYLVKVLQTLDRKFVDTELANHSVVELIRIALRLVWDPKKQKESELLSYVPNPGLARELLEYIPNKERTSHACLSLATSFCLPVQCQVDSPLRTKWLEIISALKEMLLYAKLQGNLQLVDNILVHVDLISEIVKNGLGMDLQISLPDLLDPAKLRITRDALQKNKKYELARDLSLKCGIEVDCVWAEWGLDLIEQSKFREARTKFHHVLIPTKNSTRRSSGPRGNGPVLRGMNINSVSRGPPVPVATPTPSASDKQRIVDDIVKCLTSPIFEIITNGKNSKNIPKENIAECLYYLGNYGTPKSIVDFYLSQENLGLYPACAYMLKRGEMGQEQMDLIVTHALEHKKMNELKRVLFHQKTSENGRQVSKFLMGICQYLSKNDHFLELVSFQVFMKDFVRAGLTCIRIFIEQYKTKKNMYPHIH
eukprot:TRINITY_DN632_c0_g1_i2.p1 TRINITY_DN632_c0_g1~~TRINITY_DN632_c0_g1_i2.p1  ORF type:complete len:680 (-),score=122.40 TRINITY_DN632_c0_g1_i2:27-2066(-)